MVASLVRLFFCLLLRKKHDFEVFDMCMYCTHAQLENTLRHLEIPQIVTQSFGHCLDAPDQDLHLGWFRF